MSEPVAIPNRLADVADPCTEMYYPQWSSRGIRAVRCTRPAKATTNSRRSSGIDGARRVCRIHGNAIDRAGFRVDWDDAK